MTQAPIKQTTLYLKTSVEAVVTWLQEQTALVYLDFFPMSQGGCTLQPLMLPPEGAPDASAINLHLDGFHWDGVEPRSGGVHPMPQAIRLAVEPHGQDQVALTLSCHYSPFLTYHHDLLIALLMHWPEIQPQLNANEQTDAKLESQMSPESKTSQPSIWGMFTTDEADTHLE